jgi:hypothetical protein
VFNWIHKRLTKNPRESSIALWYKVLRITTAVYFHFKSGQAVQEAQEQARAAQAESEKKK